MPTAEEQRDAARLSVTRYGQTAVSPTLDSDEVESILDDAKRVTVWTANTAYAYGDVILPTSRNGHSYRCIQAGTSEADSADEPDWPTLQQDQITEGASDPLLRWQEDGPDFDNLYNVRAAIHAAWVMKAGKAAALYSSGVGETQQVYDHCFKMAEAYSPVDIA